MKRKTPEEDLHKLVAKLLNISLDSTVIWTTIETSNQSSNMRAQAKLKAKGVMAGWPDIQLLWNDGELKGLCIELKAPKKNATDIQLAVHGILNQIGIPTVVARSIDDVNNALEVY